MPVEQDPKASTFFYDKFHDRVEDAVANPAIFKQFRQMINSFADRNSDVLQSNIMGRQLLFPDSLQQNILKLYKIDINEVKLMMNPKKAKNDPSIISPFFRNFDGMAMEDQLAFLMPIALISGFYMAHHKENEAFFVYTIMFFKPYSTRISRYFKYGVNEQQMLYTVEHLNERFDLKREGTIFNLVNKISESSFNNYKKTIAGKPTDYELYVIGTAGCYTRINASIKTIFKAYMENSGKRLNFEQSYTELDGETVDLDIESETSIKNNMAHKAILKLTKSPVNDKLLQVAVQKSFVGSGGSGNKVSPLHMNLMRSAINEIVDKKLDMLPELMDCILSSFLQQYNPATKMKYKAADIKTPIFITVSLKSFKSAPNSKDASTLRMREILTELLESCSSEYLSFEKTAKRNMRNALFFYFILVIRN